MPLKSVLDGLLASAAFADGKVVTSRIANRLTVKLKKQGEQISVQLSRDGDAPSTADWKNVLACWPGQVTIVEQPRELIPQGKRYFLRGKVRVSERLV